jgi:hypothetical protein
VLAIALETGVSLRVVWDQLRRVNTRREEYATGREPARAML